MNLFRVSHFGFLISDLPSGFYSDNVVFYPDFVIGELGFGGINEIVEYGVIAGAVELVGVVDEDYVFDVVGIGVFFL